MSKACLYQYTIYDHPRDRPDGFVVRQWQISRDGLVAGWARSAPTLAAARELVPTGLFCLSRADEDDPVIVETWT